MPPRQSQHIIGNHFLFCPAHRRVHHYTVALFPPSLTIILSCYLSLLSVPIAPIRGTPTKPASSRHTTSRLRVRQGLYELLLLVVAVAVAYQDPLE